jgi:diacylglycerol O-acyltransferase / wax synthase
VAALRRACRVLVDMTFSHHERLSALDASFLGLEDANCHMHIGSVAVFEAGPLGTSDGGVDIERVRALMEAGIHKMPRYRQRITRVPLFDHPVWVDDARFNLAYHVRHTHLPKPGDERQLKRLAGRLMSQQLDRGKPLWEMWVVEGLEGGRFAIITKVHHCLIDGVGSVELMGSVMRPTPEPDPSLAQAPARWLPRPIPGGMQLLASEVSHRTVWPLALLRTLGQVVRAPRGTAERTAAAVTGVAEAVGSGFSPASPTPLNVEIGPHRRFDWTTFDLGAFRDIRGRLGGTVNDVVLAVLSGALRRFLRRRSVSVEGIDFRAMLPVNIRAGDAQLGNRVAMIVARLPLDERDPRRRLERVVGETRVIKQSHQALGMQTLEELSDHTFTTLLTQFARLAARTQPYNLVVTNVPGPQFPIYVEGARMIACHPLVPLFRGQALGVALFSYDGRLEWGFNADWDALPDLHELVEAVAVEFALLRDAASGVTPEASSGAATSAGS